jgi:hypothetical protein
MQIYLVKFIAFYLGCMSCVVLQTQMKLNPVFASAIVGFLGTFFQLPKFDSKRLHSAIYSGSFAGMCTFQVLKGTEQMVLVSMIGSVLYLWSEKYLVGD